MPYQDIAQQTFLEHGMLKNITDALRLTIAWQVQGEDFSRKLSTLRFIAHSLQRHLEHLMSLEEYDGYMDRVSQLTPYLGRRVDALRREHDEFRQAVHRILPHLERVSPTDHAEFGKLCDELLALVARLENHDRKEADLLHEAFGQDGGGEG
jgi:hemerythrin-like domain-containing protein